MSAVDTGLSDDVVRLVETVERLSHEDQDRILRLVSLLTGAPMNVRDRTRTMLRSLLAREPRSSIECIAAIDEVLEYLEARTEERSYTRADAWWPLPTSTRRN